MSIPIWNKMNLTIKEAAEYSQIGENQIRKLVQNPNCPFAQRVGNKTLIKRVEFEKWNNTVSCVK